MNNQMVGRFLNIMNRYGTNNNTLIYIGKENIPNINCIDF